MFKRMQYIYMCVCVFRLIPFATDKGIDPGAPSLDVVCRTRVVAYDNDNDNDSEPLLGGEVLACLNRLPGGTGWPTPENTERPLAVDLNEKKAFFTISQRRTRASFVHVFLHVFILRTRCFRTHVNDNNNNNMYAYKTCSNPLTTVSRLSGVFGAIFPIYFGSYIFIEKKITKKENPPYDQIQ